MCHQNSNEILAQLIGGLISGTIGFLSAMIINYFKERDKLIKEFKNILHALYLEIEMNLTYCTNMKSGQLELNTLRNDAYLKLNLSEVALQIRGELLNEIMICYLRIENFNKKVFAYDGGLSNPHIVKELNCVEVAISKIQYLLCKFLMDKKIL